MGLLNGKNVLVTGVLTEASIAFGVARLAQQEGATVVLTGFGRGLGITRRVARRLPSEPAVLELDITSDDDLAALPDRLRQVGVDSLHGVLHAIGFAPPGALGGNFLSATWSDVSTAVQVSTFSLMALARAALPLMQRESAVVGLDFDATVAWPVYDWMGVAKAGLESASRYLARELGPAGIRVNLVAAGPLRTMAAKSIPGFEAFENTWQERAPLGWDIEDATPVAKGCAALLSDWFPATSGEMIHVDGGFHAMGV